MKLYLSIPITGRPLEYVKYQSGVIKRHLELHGHECITPFDICSDPFMPYEYYMGRDIERLLAHDIEGVVFCIGYQYSKGCRLEHAAAEIYGKRIIYQSTFNTLNFDTLTINPM